MLDLSVEVDPNPTDQRLPINYGGHSRAAIGTTILLIIMIACFSQFGCGAVETTWSAESRSPDGSWFATAKTEQHGGFGTAGIVTSVYLKRTKGSYRPVEILELFHDSRDPSRTVNLAMEWVTPSHLDVVYNGRASVDFQAVKKVGDRRNVSPYFPAVDILGRSNFPSVPGFRKPSRLLALPLASIPCTSHRSMAVHNQSMSVGANPAVVFQGTQMHGGMKPVCEFSTLRRRDDAISR